MLCLFYAYYRYFRIFTPKWWQCYFVTVLTGITGPPFITQDKRSDIPALFGNAVESVATESKRKHSVAALSHLQDYMDAIKNNLIKLGDLTYDHMAQDFLVCSATYLGKYAKNKTMVKFANGNSSASKNSVRSYKNE